MNAKTTVLLCATLAFAACHHDVPVPSDSDDGSTPKPSTSRVGVGGPTSGLVASSHFAAYLARPADQMVAGKYPIGAAGELHVVKYDGSDTLIAANVLTHNYLMAPDGSALFYIAFDLTSGPSTGMSQLMWLPLDKGAQPKMIASGMPMTPLGRSASGSRLYAPSPLDQESFFAASGNYFLVAVAPALDVRAPDLHIFDLKTGADVYQRLNGEGVYQQLMFPDDTLVFQDTVNGQSPDSPPVQTLFTVQLPGGTAAPIMQRTVAFTPTDDLQKLVIQDGANGLWLWDRTQPGNAPKSLATDVVQWSLGFDANGPIGYIATDRSVHVIGLDGSKIVDVDAATAAADFNGTPLVGTASDFYYWQNVETQANRGTLMHLPISAAAKPGKVADKISLQDFFVTGDSIVFLGEVDDTGTVGQVGRGQPDGSGLALYSPGSQVPVGGLHLNAARGQSWIGLHIAGVVTPPTMNTRDDSTLASGPLGLDDSMGHEKIISPSTHAFRFSPSARTIVFNDAASYDATAGNWVGDLSFYNSYDNANTVKSNVSGVAEIGRIVGRHLFVSAPSAKDPGIYFVTY